MIEGRAFFVRRGIKMKNCLKTFFMVSLSCFVLSANAADLNVDARSLYDRMDRLERDITLLQRRLYKGSEKNTDSVEPLPIVL